MERMPVQSGAGQERVRGSASLRQCGSKFVCVCGESMYKRLPTDQEVQKLKELADELEEAFQQMAVQFECRTTFCGSNVDNLSDLRRAMAMMLQQWCRVQIATC